MAAKNIPKEWLLRPQMNLWPPQRRRAVLWIRDIRNKHSPIAEPARIDGISAKVKVEIIPATGQTDKGS